MSELIEQTESKVIVRIDKSGRRSIEDLIVREHALTITLSDRKFAKDRQFVMVFCLPSDLEMLGLGLLLSEGIIRSINDVESFSLSDDKSELKVYVRDSVKLADALLAMADITSGCGRKINPAELSPDEFPKVSSDIKFSATSIISFVNEFQSMSALYRSTGGTHGAALCDKDKILIFKEDIGRHNAVDKVFGECLLKGIGTDDKLLLTSGRISSEILLKSAKCGVPIVVSRSAPTSMALQFAEKLGITLVGFARGGRMNIYSHDHRIINRSQG